MTAPATPEPSLAPPPLQARAIGDEDTAPPTAGFTGFRDAMTTVTQGSSDATRSGLLERIDPEEARRALFPELFNAESGDLERETRGARDSERLGRWPDAVRRWQRVVVLSEGDIEARLSLARALAQSGRTMRAGEEFDSITTSRPENVRGWVLKGNFETAQDRLADAEISYRQALRLDGKSREGRNNLAALYLRQQRWRDAEVLLMQLNSDSPEYAPGWLNRALFEESGRQNPSQALGALEAYLRLGGRQTEAVDRWLARLRAGSGLAVIE